jgi:hypothetical protein
MIVGPDGRVGPWPGHAWPHRTVIFARVCAFPAGDWTARPDQSNPLSMSSRG